MITVTQNTGMIEYFSISVFCVLSWGPKRIVFAEQLSIVLDFAEHLTNLFCAVI
jgi:hypothetical protein